MSHHHNNAPRNDEDDDDDDEDVEHVNVALECRRAGALLRARVRACALRKHGTNRTATA